MAKSIFVLRIFLLIIGLVIFGCKDQNEEKKITNDDSETLKPKYAKGFEIIKMADYSVLKINSPWPNSEKTYNYAIIERQKAPSMTLPKDEYDGIILSPVSKLVVTSTTHLPAIEYLNEIESLIGFPELNYISNSKIRGRIEDGKIQEIGKNESLNTEILINLNPEMVMGFSIDGVSKTYKTLQNAGIPVVFNGDWTESSPLGKAEWVKVFGLLFEKESKADSLFSHIESVYIKAKSLATNSKTAPTAISGAIYKDIWYMPYGNSFEGQLMKDANINYVWSDSRGKGSMEFNFESVLEKGANAEIWLNPSNYHTKSELQNSNVHYNQFDAFKNGNIYTMANTTGATGGVLYYELGTARPDLVLIDLVKIAHPELFTDYEFTFFQKLPN